MGDVLTPFTVPSPPPPTSSSSIQNNNMSMLYYGLVMMGTAAIVLGIYNIIIIKHCNRNHTQSSSQSEEPNPLVIIERVVEIRNFDNSQRNLLSSFKYKKKIVEKGEGGVEEKEGGVDSNDYDCECPVCLSVYEEGEEVRKLPKCKHSFHALCIDMWLYSHFDCPVCRTTVGDSFCNFPAENSRGGLMESSGISG